MRPLIQYDLDEPPTAPLAPPAPRRSRGNAQRPSAKRRKRNHHNPQKSQLPLPREAPFQHWDDPGSTAVGVVYDESEGSTTSPALHAPSSVAVPYADDVEGEEEEYGEDGAEGDEAIEEEEENGELTHEEIWDDAALIDAWNSAEAEYQAYHGASKAWKTEPIKKSPLWYKKPYTAPTPKPRSNHTVTPLRPREQEAGESEPDTAPLDFDTYVPTHDPSLALPLDTSSDPAATAPFSFPPPSTTMVSRDEAFNNALSAMYWGGYWTAVYHCQSQSGGNNTVTAGATENDELEEDEDDEDLVPAQR